LLEPGQPFARATAGRLFFDRFIELNRDVVVEIGNYGPRLRLDRDDPRRRDVGRPARRVADTGARVQRRPGDG